VINLDWNATAPLSPVARKAWLDAHDQAWANPSSIHGLGRAARHHLDQARSAIARAIGAQAHELVLTSGGTEALAVAIHAGCSLTGQRPKVVVGATEHSAVQRNAAAWGEPVSVPVDGSGLIDPQVLAGCANGAAVVAVQFANNETGVCQDLPALVAAVRAVAPKAWFVVDACQGIGKVPLSFAGLGVDALAFAGHKFGAPKGVGGLFVRTGLRLPALLQGGRQQQDRRSGTEDPALAAACAAALGEACDESERDRQRGLLEHLFASLLAALPEVVWLGRAAPRLPNTLSLLHPRVANEVLVQRLDLDGCAVSTGSACMAARGQPSHVVAAMGVPPDLARSAIRVSIGPGTTPAELEHFAAAYIRAVRALAGR
jgi:cysteine desulfurase